MKRIFISTLGAVTGRLIAVILMAVPFLVVWQFTAWMVWHQFSDESWDAVDPQTRLILFMIWLGLCLNWIKPDEWLARRKDRDRWHRDVPQRFALVEAEHRRQVKPQGLPARCLGPRGCLARQPGLASLRPHHLPGDSPSEDDRPAASCKRPLSALWRGTGLKALARISGHLKEAHMRTAEQMVIRTPTEVYVDRLASTRYACVEDAVKAAVSAARSTGSTWNVVRWVATGEFTIEEREHAE